MLELLRKSLCIVLAWFLVVTATASAQTPAPGAPVPPQILSAQAVFVSNGGGGNYFDGFTGGSNRAYNTLYAELQRSNRYQLVSSPSQADLIFEIRGIAPAVSYGDTVGNNPQLILSIIDPKTRAVLWTTNANVRAFGRQKRRDQGLDQSVAVVLNKFSEVTGQSLTPSQAKAVRDNSRMPSAAKIFLFVGIAATAGLAIYGIYRVTHPPTLAPPTLPAVR
jgi:hypothetical protein